MKNNIQVPKQHYNWKNYIGEGRWYSYYLQINEVMKSVNDGERILLIGVGDGLVPLLLKRILEINGMNDVSVTTFDFDERLFPDVVGDVTELQNYFDANSFDVIICVEVLEHIPYIFFERVLKDIQTICTEKGMCILGLPFQGYGLEVGVIWQNPMPKKHRFKLVISKFYRSMKSFSDNEHYWELGFKETQLKKVRRVIEMTGWKISDMYFEKECIYHVIILLRKE